MAVSYSAISDGVAIGTGQTVRDGSEHGRERSVGSHQRRRRSFKDIGFAGEASWISSNINLLNTIVGAGVLVMPYAMSQMGIFLGTIVLIWSALASGFGLYLQTLCARYLDRGGSSFFALSQITYPNAAVIFDAAIAIKCFGVGVSYLIIIGDLMPGVVLGFKETANEIPFLVNRSFWITAFMFVVIPLSFLRRLDSLKYTSVIALISIGYLVILVVYHYCEGDTLDERGQVSFWEWQGPIASLSSLPLIVFAYTCHQNMFSVLNEIKDNSYTQATTVIGFSIGSACSIYILVAITGYISFGNSVGGNIVGMYSPSIASTIAKGAIVVLVMFSYPLQVHPCRASIDAVLKWRPERFRSSRDSVSGTPSRAAPLLSRASGPSSRNEAIGEFKFALITTIILVLSYIVAVMVSSLDKVLAYVGSTGSTSISFILPGLFYYKISAPESLYHQRLTKEDDDEYDSNEDEGLFANGTMRPSPWRQLLLRRLALGLSIYGVLVMIICFITNIFFSVSH